MTEKDTSAEMIDDDQQAYEFSYGHGRMPFFMKIVWVGFLVGGTWYVVVNVLGSLAKDLK